jgi:SanA protein
MFRCLAKLILLLVLLVAAGLFVLCQLFVSHAGAGRIYTTTASTPARDTGLVLGTSEKLANGDENPYFQKRIEAAAELYHQGKVKRFIVSGDNRTASYNEPEAMRKALVAKGVPDNAICLDYAGLRTLDSIVRAKEIFSQNRFTIISQFSHDERALLIARHYDIDAIAFAAPDAPFSWAKGAHIREYFARVKVILDLYILHTQPKHLGPKVSMDSRN